MLPAFDPMAAGARPKSEADMEDEIHPARKRPLTALARVARRSRIFARLREGAAYDEIAQEERLTAERVRQIVREALARRLTDEDTDHAKLQLDRLRSAMRVATAAVEGGDVAAIPSLLKVLDRLDRYQKTAKVNQVYDDDARKKLFEKLNRVAANLGLAVIEDPAKAEEKPAPEPAPEPELAAPEPPAGDKEKMPWGVGATS
jgi:CRISPR/Cas system CSM-associated protein Csm2 small subunit